MKTLRFPLFFTFGLFSCVWSARADRLELADGSVIVGRILSAEEAKFKVETAFAGTIEVAQAQVKSFTTDEPVHVALAAGSTVLGKVAAAPAGIAVVAADGEMRAPTDKISALWRPGADSPEIRAAKEAAKKAQRAWQYEASAAIAGRTGGSEKFGANLGFKATLASPQDKLVFAFQIERAEDNGLETANRLFGGVDYSAFYSKNNVWYVRTSLEKDDIKSLDLRSTTAFGVGRKLINNKKQDLEARLGVSYLFESYSNGTNFDSPGADIALLHSFLFSSAKLTNSISYTPAFEDFANFRLRHESALELPLANPQWKLRLGVANDYQSVPPAGTERLDTTYFTTLLLNWQ